VNKVDELALWKKRLALAETELAEVKKWVKSVQGIPNAVMYTLIEGEVTKEMKIEKYKEWIENLKNELNQDICSKCGITPLPEDSQHYHCESCRK